MADVIGAVQVNITGDQTQLNASINSAVNTAQQGGTKIGAALTGAVGPANNLTAATNILGNAATNTAAQIQAQANTVLLATQAAQGLGVAQGQAAAAAATHTAALGHQVSQVQATSGAIRVLEGSGGLRAVENFLAKTLGLGPVFQSIFPIVGAIAFAEILGKIGGELYKFYQDAQNAPERCFHRAYRFAASR